MLAVGTSLVLEVLVQQPQLLEYLELDEKGLSLKFFVHVVFSFHHARSFAHASGMPVAFLMASTFSVLGSCFMLISFISIYIIIITNKLCYGH